MSKNYSLNDKLFDVAATLTPLMQQYTQFKAKYHDAILLFRVGDFYETFGQDAITVSSILGIVLTKRNNGGNDIELAGFPFHSLDVYLPKLIKAGMRVAICEQMEKPSPQKKIVRRGITEVLSPGLAADDTLIDHKTNNFLCSVSFGKHEQYGVAFLDLSTGEFLVSEGDYAHTDKLLQNFNPSEVIFSRQYGKDFEHLFTDKYYTYPVEDWVFEPTFTREKLLQHFEVKTLKGYGIEELFLAQTAAGAIIHYLHEAENNNLKHIYTINKIFLEKYVWLDKFTIRNLELINANHEQGISLLQVLDKTISPMGARLLRKWIILPLISKDAIENRLAMVQYFMEKEHDFDSPIRVIGDLERLIAKVPLAKINPREVQQLRRALQAIEPIKLQLANSNQISLQKFAEGLNSCQVLQSEITKMIVDDAPTNTLKGNFIADGANVELDELRHIIKNSQQLLLELQQREINKTGISNLKIGFNSVFGYYLEVTNKFKDQTPESWIRKQTLANAERYVTEELKNLETKILSAEEKMLALEEQLYQKLLGFILDYVQPVKHNAAIIAQLDCLLCFAKIAEKNNYCKPEITEDFTLDIRSGRHPVIEQQLPLGEVFVPNDTFLDTEQIQIMLLTGPNMSGKSALLRQTALICLMAQMGSYVPANQAFIGIVDKIFTRVGASDNISSGESTFMVEMNETASILNNISERSLILLDEIGRGTSTYDGISIAWSIAEYLHDNLLAKPKTLFATHYHELNELAERHSRIHNFHIATKELNNKVIFLRKLTPGGSHHSFGIHVARMAGMPKSIVERANEILLQLEQQSIENGLPNQQAFSQKVKQVSQPLQLNIFGATNPELEKITQEILSLDLNSLTPIECMMKLQQWKHLLQT